MKGDYVKQLKLESFLNSMQLTEFTAPTWLVFPLTVFREPWTEPRILILELQLIVLLDPESMGFIVPRKVTDGDDVIVLHFTIEKRLVCDPPPMS